MNKKLLFIIALLTFSLAGCANNNDLTKVTLMLDYTPNTNHSGIIAAKEQGFYEDQGIDLEIIQPAEVNSVTSVATNQVDFGVSYQEDVVLANNQGMNITSIYGILNHNTSGLISKKDKNIKTPKDLENKTYCGWGSDLETSIISSLMEENNADPSKLTIINSGTNFISDTGDECDVFWEFESWAGIQAQQNNIAYNYIPFVDYGFDEYTPVIITSQDYVDNNKELVQSFINATIKGYQYAYDNPEKTANIFVSVYPEYNLDFITASQNYINQYYINDTNDMFGYQSSNIWNDFSDYLINNNLVENKSDKDFTNEFIDKYYESND